MFGISGTGRRTLSRTKSGNAAACGSTAKGIVMVRDLLGQAYGAMKHDRRRATLTMLGMAWGIATVVLLLAYGAGFGRAIDAIFSNFGAKIMIVVPGRTSLQAGGAKAGQEIKLEYSDMERVRDAVPLIKHITPEVGIQGTIQAGNRTYQMPVSANFANVQPIRALRVDYGRFYNDEDDMQH